MSGFQWIRDFNLQSMFDYNLIEIEEPYTPVDSLAGFQWIRDYNLQSIYDYNLIEIEEPYAHTGRNKSMGFQWTKNNNTSVQFRTDEIIPTDGFLIEEAGMIKTVKINAAGLPEWVIIGPAPATVEMFDGNSLGAAAVEEHLHLIQSDTFKLLALDRGANQGEMKLVLDAVPAPTTVVQQEDFLVDVDALERLYLRQQSPDKHIKLALSFDSGLTWQTYDTSTDVFAWRTITPSTQDLMQHGMTPDVFDSITKEEWESLRNGSGTVRFAFCFDINSLEENTGIDEIISIVELKGEWVHHDTDISHSSRDVIIYLYQNGTYKINYVE